MKTIRWHIIAGIVLIAVVILLSIWKALTWKATPDWVKRERARRAVREQAQAIAASNSPDMVEKLISFIGTDASDIAMWKLSQLGPKAALAKRDIEMAEQRRVEHARRIPYLKDYRPGRPEILERIVGCIDGRSTETENTFRSRTANKNIGSTGWQGYYSNVDNPSVFVAGNRESWANLWQRHGGHPTCRPEIDFEKEIAVGIFLGQTTFTELPALSNVTETGGTTTVLYSDGFSDAGSDQPINPYIFIKVKRPAGSLKVIRTRYYAMSTKKPEDTLMVSMSQEQLR